MNKKLIITIGAIVSAFVLGIGIYHSDASQADPNLSVEDVEEMVKGQYPGEITNVETEKEHNRIVYDVEVTHDERAYEIRLDGQSGEVLKLKEKDADKEHLQLDEQKEQDKADENDEEHQSQDEKQADQNEGKNSNADENSNEDTSQQVENDDAADAPQETGRKTGIDSKQAIDIALKEFPGTVVELELETEDGRLIYEVEIEAGDEEAEIEIDAHTGEILVIDID